jgi:hypothetical protein
VTCSARIRPFTDDTEIACEREGDHDRHEGSLSDYAYAGSRSTLSWMDDDRRTFHGEWPGACELLHGCVLPAGHHGGHAL